MLENPIVLDETLFPQTVFDYTLAVEVASWMPEWYELYQHEQLVNDNIHQRGEKMKYRELYNIVNDHYKLTKTLFYLQSGVSIILSFVLLASSIF